MSDEYKYFSKFRDQNRRTATRFDFHWRRTVSVIVYAGGKIRTLIPTGKRSYWPYPYLTPFSPRRDGQDARRK